MTQPSHYDMAEAALAMVRDHEPEWRSEATDMQDLWHAKIEITMTGALTHAVLALVDELRNQRIVDAEIIVDGDELYIPPSQKDGYG